MAKKYDGFEINGIDGNELYDMICKVYRKYSEAFVSLKDVNLSFEDLVQDAFLRIIECNPKNSGHAAVIVRNWFIDKIRYNHRRVGRLNDSFNPLDSTSNTPDEAESAEIAHPKYGRDFSESIQLEEALGQLGPRERRFAVAKGYLCGNIEQLESEFFEMVSELDSESLALFVSSDKNTDDMIYKVFCGIKSGVNAGSSRVIRGNLKSVLLLGSEA